MKLNSLVSHLVINLQFWFRVVLAFALPYLIFSSLMRFASYRINAQLEEDDKVVVALLGQEFLPNTLYEQFQQVAEIRFVASEEIIKQLIEKDSVEVGFVFYAGFDADSIGGQKVDYYIKSMGNNPASKLLDIIDSYEEQLVLNNFKALNLDETQLKPLVVNQYNSFSYFEELSRNLEQAKGGVSGFINLFLVLFVFWIIRFLVLRIHSSKRAGFFVQLTSLLALSYCCMILVYLAIYIGLNTEVEGLAKSITLNLNNLLVWKSLHQLFWMWLPTLLFVIGLLGRVSISTSPLKAYKRTFWVVVLLHVVALLGQFPIQEMTMLQQASPLINTFQVGQLAFKGSLVGNEWWIALFFACFWAFLINYSWYQQYQKLKP